MERTLAVFYSPTPSLRTKLEEALLQAGFNVRDQVEAVDEELEEAGLEPSGQGEEVKHWAVVLERRDAVKALKDLKGEGHAALNPKALSALFPDLNMHCSPSLSAANMSISTLFPQLNSLTTPSPSPAAAAPASSVEGTPTPSKPFALSNLAHPAPLVLNTNAREKQLSPSIERALRDLELKEESRRRKISGGSAGSRSSLGVALAAEKPNGQEQEQEQETEEETDEEGETGGDGRRVFSARSRDTTAEFNVYPDAEDDTLQPHDTLPKDEQQEELASPAVEEEQPFSPLAPSDSVSLSSAHRLTRQTSTISSSASTTSATSSHRRTRSSLSAPAIQPRMTKAAALRLGIPYEPTPMRRQSSVNSVITTSSSTESRVVPTPKSLAAPSIAPRPTKASALRDGTGAPASAAPVKRRETIGTAERAALDRQRRASLAGGEVSALQQQQRPKVEVRMSKAAMLRQGMELPPSAAAMRRQASESSATSDASAESVKATRRQSLSGAIKSTAAPKILPRQTKASALRTGVDSPIMTRGRSASALEDLREEGADDGPSAPPMVRAKTTTSFEGVPGHKRRESVGVPSLSAPPKIAVRLTKAAALRTGQEVQPSPAMRRQASATSSEGGEGGFEGVPGHKRRESIQVASTAKPKIQPRMSRASMLRLGMEVESPSLRRTSSTPTPVDFEGVPGHPRRRESLSVASLAKPPSITPRLNRSTLLRQASSESNPSSVSPTLHRRAQSSLGLAPSPSSTGARPSSALSSISNLTLPTTATAGTRVRSAHSSSSSHSTAPTAAPAPTASAKPPATPRAPTIAPRSNKSAMLRAAKMEAEAAKAKGGATKARKAGGPPSLLSGMMGKGRPSTALGLSREVKGSKGSEENEEIF